MIFNHLSNTDNSNKRNSNKKSKIFYHVFMTDRRMEVSKKMISACYLSCKSWW